MTKSWANSVSDIAILARKELDLVISWRKILSLNHGNCSCREMLGSNPHMTNSGQSGVPVVATVSNISALCLGASVVKILAFKQTRPETIAMNRQRRSAERLPIVLACPLPRRRVQATGVSRESPHDDALESNTRWKL
jgi:hypothetical protein